MPAPVKWDFQISGADDVVSSLRSIKEAQTDLDTSTKHSTQSWHEQARAATMVINEDRYRERVLLASRPALLETVRIGGLISGMARTASAGLNMMNLALILAGQKSGSLSDKQMELARAQAQYNADIERFGADSPQAIKDLGDINALQGQVAQATRENQLAQVDAGISFVTSAALIGSSIATMLPRIMTFAAGAVVSGVSYDGALASMSTATSVFGITMDTVMAAVPFIALAAAAVAAAILIYQNWDKIVAFFKPFIDWMQNTFAPVLGAVWNALVSAATTAWNILHNAFVALWNGWAGIANVGIKAISDGIISFLNGAIDMINGFLTGINTILAAAHLPTIGVVGHVTWQAPQIPTITAAAGFNGVVNQPTLFLAGEAGQSESVQIGSPNSGGSGGVSMVNHFHGSIMTERQVSDMVLRRLERKLRDRGW